MLAYFGEPVFMLPSTQDLHRSLFEISNSLFAKRCLNLTFSLGPETYYFAICSATFACIMHLFIHRWMKENC